MAGAAINGRTGLAALAPRLPDPCVRIDDRRSFNSVLSDWKHHKIQKSAEESLLCRLAQTTNMHLPYESIIPGRDGSVSGRPTVHFVHDD